MTKLKYLMVSECPKCGETLIRPPECSHAICVCSNPYMIVELHPALILPTRIYNQFQKVVDQANVSLERLINAILEVGIEKIKRMGIKEFLEVRTKNETI